MTNNQEELFEELEKLNAQIDIRIDDEEYDNIWCDTKGIITLSNSAKSRVKECFPDDNGHCTHDKDKEWREALGFAKNALPVAKVGANDLKEHKKDTIVQAWSHLFYAKLLRAKIQQRSFSDCYVRRLDDVAAYLERHLPQHDEGQEEWVRRLKLMYLMELSATSQDWESLGFSERAHRVITDAKRSFGVNKAKEKAPYEFYDLWARYNIGVAYFHRGYYRKAVLEFNWIIWQVEQWRQYTKNRNTFRRNHGIELLYLPSILSRSEIQLKLQFAYHSLDMLNKRFWSNNKISVEKRRTLQKEIRAKIIEAQAYQQMGQLLNSWDVLENVFGLICPSEQLRHRKVCKRPRFNQRFPSLEERFNDILIADHLDWLTLKGDDERKDNRQKEYLELRYIVRYGNTKGGNRATAQDYKDAVEKALPYLKKLVSAFSDYFKVVEYHNYNRRGYFQQLAKYLAWLAKAADFNCDVPDSTNVQGEVRKKIADIAKPLYDENHDRLLEEEEEKKPGRLQGGCHYCDAKGIDLRNIDIEHYKWFTEDMLEFFNCKNIFEPKDIGKDKKIFVRRLINREWKDRDDLRIRDLELRYEFYEKGELLKKLCTGKQSNFDYAQELCWRELGNQADLLNLLRCKRETNDNQEDDPSSTYLKDSDYIKIMKDWDDGFLHHLNSPSTHELPESGFYFLGLQRWNSASPAKGYSIGGGYLLYHLDSENKVDMGIAIDPGFDFVRNLFHMGFSLDDIDIVLISHAHLDHIRDFESIVMLLSELKKRGQREKRVHVILSLGAYKKLEHIVEDPGFRYLIEPYIIDVDREINVDYFEEKEMRGFSFEPVNTNGECGSSNYIERFRAVLPGRQSNKDLQVEIKPTRAYHDDRTNYSDSFGFLINLAEKVKKQNGEEKQSNLIFGYTGDTKWVYPNMLDPIEKGNSKGKREGRKIKDIAEQYEKCNVLLVHLGSLIGKNDDGELSFAQYDQCNENFNNKYKCEELVRKKDHPYLIGMLRLLSSLYDDLPGEGSNGDHKGKPLVLVSEFGEELRGTIRIDLIRRLQELYEEKLAFLLVDVGMNVYLCDKGDKRQDNSHNDRCACKVWCVQCNLFVNIGDADYELCGTDHALYCVCKTCRKATPTNVLQERLRQLYEVGLELRPYESK